MIELRSAVLCATLLLALSFFGTQNAMGNPTFIKDINTTLDISQPDNFYVSGSRMYFLADDGKFGRELWVTDGTDNGTVMLKDINPGSSGTFADDGDVEFAEIGDLLFFSAFDSINGAGLWKTDGTEQGTELVKSFDNNNDSADDGTGISQLLVIGSLLYFVADENDTGRELWKSDGTAGGTVLVKDIRTGSRGSIPQHLTAYDSGLYFVADDGTNGRELWVSNGTSGGTQLLKDIRPDSQSSGPDNLTVYNGKLYFTAFDGTNGTELWVSNGFTSGTEMLRDINPSSGASSNPRYLTLFDGKLYFSADAGGGGNELWRTDGTVLGTELVHDINTTGTGGADSNPNRLFVFKGELYFNADDGIVGNEIWKTDGVTPSLLKDINDSSSSHFIDFHSDGANLYFSARTAANGREPWISDGTTNGTVLLKDLNPGTESSSPKAFGFLGGFVYIGGFDDDLEELDAESPVFVEQLELWRSNGTTAGTVLFKDINQATRSAQPDEFTDLNGTLVFTAKSKGNGEELWRSNGTAADTVLVKDIWAGLEGSEPEDLTSFGDLVFFQANDGNNGLEIWRSDGTNGGTFLLKDIEPGSRGSSLNDETEFVSLDGQTVFFPRKNSANGMAIWQTDGTVMGTTLFFDLNDSFNAKNFFRNGSKFYFSAPDASDEKLLWESDGTVAGTAPLADVSSLSFAGPFNFSAIGNTTYFFADNVGGIALWKTDGTAGGTMTVKTGFDTVEEEVMPLSLGDTLYFFANDDISGLELWKTDGTEAGTQIVKDIVADGGIDNVERSDFVSNGSKLFFIIDDEVNGKEIWTSDGTEAGTFLLRNINGLPTGSDVDDMLVVDDLVYFEANDNVTGEELWVTDGTTAGTKLAHDIWPGLLGSDPDELIRIGDTIYIEADDAAHQDELWKLQINIDDDLCVVVKAANGNVASFCL